MEESMKKIRNILILITFYILMVFHCSEVQAASATISANKTSATVGETVTITVSVNAAAWNIHVTGAATGTFADSTDDAENTSFTKQVTFTPSAPGNYTVNMSGDVSEGSNNQTKPITGSVAIAVKEKPATSTNSTPTNTNTNTNTPDTPAAPATTKEPETPKKSNNAKLSNLGFTPNDFKGFTANKTSYSATVPNSVSSIEIYAKKGQSGQTISGTGKKTLQEGTNQFSVTVTAEDGTTKSTYTLSITREAATAQEENTTENETTSENTTDTNTVAESTTNDKDDETKLTVGLSNLSITGVTLSPTFQKDVYEYTAKLIGDKTMLDINTTAIDEGQTIEIVGNEDLQEGENIITIMVTDEKEEKTATYQITVNKSLVDEEAIAKEREKEEQEKRQNMTILAVIVGAIVIVSLILIVRYIRYRREGDYEDDDYDDAYFEDEEDEQPEFVEKEKEEPEIELPKRKKEKIQEITEMQEFDDIEERIRKNKSKGKRFKD